MPQRSEPSLVEGTYREFADTLSMNHANNALHTLQELVLPSPELMLPEALYWSSRKAVAYNHEGKSLDFAAGGRIEFNSFHNAFAAKQWELHDKKHRLHILVEGNGELHVEVHAVTPKDRFLLTAAKVNFETEPTVGRATIELPDIYRTPADCDKIIYIIAWSEGRASLKRVSYCTALPPRRTVKLGAVITHFKREKWVLPALARMSRELLGDVQIAPCVHVFVIDNSRSLPPDHGEGITVIPNRNLGGAGGFTRGLLETEDGDGFTHCLFMDDDATMEIEPIKRTIRFLSYCEERVSVAGGLFLLSQPTEAFESSGRWNHTTSPVCYELDVSKPENLAKYVADDELGQYGGWWFYAFGLKDFRYYPFPFFVRGDDIGFGLMNGLRIKSLLGVASWAECFESKESVVIAYLNFRHMVMNSVVAKSCSPYPLMRLVTSWTVRLLICYRYAAAEATLKALEDGLKGEAYWRDNLDTALLREQLAPLAADESYVPPRELESRLAEKGLRLPPIRREFKETLLRWIVRHVSLNGHLLPPSWCQSVPAVLPKTYLAPATMVFPHTTVVMRRETDGQMAVVRRDIKRAMAILLRLPFVLGKVWWAFTFDRQRLTDIYNRLTTREFWLEVYPECRKSSAGQTESPSPSPVGAH